MRVTWSPKRESTVYVLAEATQNKIVSLLHYCKQVLTLYSNLTDKNCVIWEPKKLLYVQCLLNTCIPSEDSNVHSALHHVMHTGTEVIGKKYCDNCTIHMLLIISSILKIWSKSKPCHYSPYIYIQNLWTLHSCWNKLIFVPLINSGADWNFKPLFCSALILWQLLSSKHVIILYSNYFFYQLSIFKILAKLVPYMIKWKSILEFNKCQRSW